MEAASKDVDADAQAHEGYRHGDDHNAPRIQRDYLNEGHHVAQQLDGVDEAHETESTKCNKKRWRRARR
eukprot:CAMPEP_0170640380 /NCGR_PEP_ID=MMETSP0224-20130122/40194_1 /TAXON_ID=285029 /ORGANISM="Togula jolla, Strain CCCM 725" /LENGTH=68 /DNA_ID=CAMNT_0010970883 /DNA_START=412 /DNA_END=618 /DNA_ORIENTATION=+